MLWCILLNYQVVQGLMCEARKWDIREEQEAHKRTIGFDDTISDNGDNGESQLLAFPLEYAN